MPSPRLTADPAERHRQQLVVAPQARRPRGDLVRAGERGGPRQVVAGQQRRAAVAGSLDLVRVVGGGRAPGALEEGQGRVRRGGAARRWPRTGPWCAGSGSHGQSCIVRDIGSSAAPSAAATHGGVPDMLRRARVATLVYFVVLGLADGVWLARIPAVKQNLGLVRWAARRGPARRAGRAGDRRGVRGPADRQVRQRAAHRGGRRGHLAAARRFRAGGQPGRPDGRAVRLRHGGRPDGRGDERPGGARGTRVPAPADQLVSRVLQLRRAGRGPARRAVRLGGRRPGPDVHRGRRAPGRGGRARAARAAARARGPRPALARRRQPSSAASRPAGPAAPAGGRPGAPPPRTPC